MHLISQLLHILSNMGKSFLLASHSFYSHESRLSHRHFIDVLSLSRSRCLSASALFAFQHPSQSERILTLSSDPFLKQLS